MKALVLGFFAVYWVIVTALPLAARPLYDEILQFSGNQATAEVPSIMVLTALFVIMSTRDLWLGLDLLTDPGRLHGRPVAHGLCGPAVGRDRARSGARVVCRAARADWPGSVRDRDGHAGGVPDG